MWETLEVLTKFLAIAVIWFIIECLLNLLNKVTMCLQPTEGQLF